MAVKKSSALQAVLKRTLLDEAVVALGLVVGGGNIDVEACYDNISLLHLLEQGEAWGYPVQLLALSVTQYLAPRYLVWQGWTWPRCVWPGKSVATGDKYGNNAARLALYGIVERMHQAAPSALPG
eukprot:5409533-Lingulodinium_polyedra.AAC.1